MGSRLFSTVRITFGLVWLADGILWLQPGVTPILFVVNVYSGVQGQPSSVSPWLYFWFNLIESNPSVFMDATTVLSLMLGVILTLRIMRKPAYLLEAAFSIFI
ncbi:MAG: hypothetical protein QXP58_08470 [Thermoprotei archaeon]